MSGGQTVVHAVVGAGPAGLAAARAMLNLGMAVDVFERHHSIGGIWDRTNPGTPMYESAHFISSRQLSGFTGFPMPADYPDYPRQDQVLAYLRSFADAYGLTSRVRLGVGVERAAWSGNGWDITTTDGHTRTYRTITCANGTQWHPNMPIIPGQESFGGTVIHSSAYDTGASLADQRVLIIGAGNSGVDIACDAARFARSASISVRRGYHLIPKHILGKPADVFAETGPHLPLRVQQILFPWLLKTTYGDPTKLGWPKPDHRILESHPIVNDQIVHHLRHGDIEVRADVSKFDGVDVVFVDGRREQYDLVICATGYDAKIPYIDPACFDWKGGRPKLFLKVFSPLLDGLACLGFTEGDGAAYELWDNMADMIARASLAAESDPATYERMRNRFAGPDIDTSGGTRYLASDRHSTYVNLHAWKKVQKSFRAEMGWPMMRPDMFETCRVQPGSS